MIKCIHQEEASPGEVRCLNTAQVITYGPIPRSVCLGCPYRTWEETPDFFQQTGDLFVRQSIRAKIGEAPTFHTAQTPERPEFKDNGFWYAGIAIAPRAVPCSVTSVESIRKAGWYPTIFAEPDSQIRKEDYSSEFVQNEVRKGVWFNWLQICEHALNTDAQWILTIQDDSLFHPDSRWFMEKLIESQMISGPIGFISLYTPAHYSTTTKPGINLIRTQWLWGACALAFPRESLQRIVEHNIARDWMGVGPNKNRDQVMQNRRENPALIQNADTAIGKICNALQLPMYFVDPSPVNHFAQKSSINHGSNAGRRNCGRCSDHSRSLFKQVKKRVGR